MQRNKITVLKGDKEQRYKIIDDCLYNIPGKAGCNRGFKSKLHRFIRSVNDIDQSAYILSLFFTQRIILMGIPQCDYQPDRMLQTANFTNFLIIEPTKDTGRQSLRCGFRSQISSSNSNINGTVIVLFYLCTKRSRFYIRCFSNNNSRQN